MDAITTPAHRDAAARLRAHLALYESKRDLVMLGAYKRGSDPRLDAALSRIDAIESFLRQDKHEHASIDDAIAQLARIA